MIARAGALATALLGCGRIGFDPVSVVRDGGEGVDDGGVPPDAFVPAQAPVSALAMTLDDTCFIAGGELWCWGAELGATPAAATAHADWREVSGGEAHRCGIRGADLVLECWGDNFEGALGTGDADPRTEPTQVTGGGAWRQVGAARFATCAIATGGRLFCWGRNDQGELGLGDTDDRLEPIRVDDVEWAQLCTGGNHSCAVRVDGSLWCWGSNEFGQVGVGSNQLFFTSAQQVAGSWRQVTCGKEHTCAIAGAGTLHCWGNNTMGQLGLGDRGPSTHRAVPEQVGTASDWQDLGNTRFSTCGVRAGGLECWGDNTRFAVGVPGSTYHVTPAALPGSWRGVGESNGEYICAIADDGGLWCWGANASGQLGTGDTEDRDAPVRILPP